MAESENRVRFLEFQINQKDQSFTYPSAFGGNPERASSSSSSSSPSSSVSPTVLFVIVILAVVFFIMGLLHLLIRLLLKQQNQSDLSNRFTESSTSDDIQRQLQQLFNLHDSGLDQAFIDALPVFQYKEIMGTKEEFDCAVCLCEFSEKDKLRLLPMCSHAFHINCIDTWLLTNSTCPLCRNSLYSLSFPMENVPFDFDDPMDEEEIGEKGSIVAVRLGKFRKLDDDNDDNDDDDDEVREVRGETSSSNLDARRCFSMGSYEYVLGDSDLRVHLSHHDHQIKSLIHGDSDLRVPLSHHDHQIKSSIHGDSDLRVSLSHHHDHHQIKSMIHGDSDLRVHLSHDHHQTKSSIHGDTEGKRVSAISKGESFSVSKIWLWSKKGKLPLNNQMGLPYSSNIELPWMQENNRNQS